ncbi:MAG: LacI family DNA-binding transcriptional regulator [Faecousia sp.]
MKKTSERPTIEGVAKMANVSVATVSRIINGSASVSKPTMLRVQEAIDTLGYVPNLSARNLRKGESCVVLIMAPNFTNPYYSHILSGICDTAQSFGYSAFICSGKTSSGEATMREILKTKRADGAIMLTCNYDDAWLNKDASRFPMVQCSEAADGVELPYVSIDNYRAMRDSVAHVCSLGHTRISFITIDNKFLSTRLRYQGYHDEIVEQLGEAAFQPELISRTVDYSFESGRKAALQQLSSNNRPTALVCCSDVLALGAIAAAHELGLQVPRDLSVVGFDDVDYTKMFHPYLTTIQQPCYELGCQSMRMLQKCIAAGQNTAERIILPHEVKVRESTARRANP